MVTKRARGVPNCGGAAMRTAPLGPWGHEACEGCAEVDPRRHAGPGTGAFGGAPYGATKCVRGVPRWVRWAHAKAAAGAFGGVPHGATKRVRGVPKWDMHIYASLPPPRFYNTYVFNIGRQ